MPSRACGQVPEGGRGSGVLVAMLLTLCSSSVAGHCLNHINVTGGPLVISAADTLSVKVLVRETEAVGHLLYWVTWDEDVTPTIPDQGDFASYFHVDDSAAREWSVTVKESMIGLPDYPILKTLVSALVVFPAFSDGDVCSLLLSHHLVDNNTQTPTVKASSWFIHIPKDFPTSTPLQGLTVTVTDNDAATPNNLMEVGVEGACPFVVGERQYGGVAGEGYVVHLHLTSPLNALVNQSFICMLRVTVVGSSLNTFPAPVKVKGDDLTLSQVTYTIRNAWSGVNEVDFFTINNITGEVSLGRELDGSWAAGGGTFVPLVIQAQDSSGSVSTAILQVVMRTQDTSIPHPQHFTTPGPPCRPASSTACPCLATRSRGRPRLSFTRLSYAAEVFSTDTFVGRVEASVGGRGGRVRYSWVSPTNVTRFIINSISGVITIKASGVPPGRHLLTVRAAAGRLTATAQVSVRVLGEEKEEKGGGGNWLRWIRTVCTCEPSDLLGLQVAIGVLASLLGLGLIAASVSGVLLYRRSKAREVKTRTEVKCISTLGSAYPNLSFSRESPE